MASDPRGYLTLDTVAACFEVEIRWLEEVCAFGLLGTERRVTHTVVISVDQLERVARIVRLHRQGVNLEGIAILIGTRRVS